VAWTLLLAGLWKVGYRGAGAAKLASLVVSAFVPVVTWVAIRRSLPGRSLAAGVAVIALALDADFASWASSGMDTPLWTLACIGCVALAAYGLDRTFLCALGALVWIRPEGPLFAAAAVIASSRGWRDAMRRSLWAAGPIAVLLLLRVAYFHDVVPNTFWAKMNAVDGKDYTGLGYLANTLLHRALFLFVAPAVASVLLRRQPMVRIALSLLAASLLFPVLAGGDWMPNRRLTVVSLPLAAWLTANALGALRYSVVSAIASAGILLEPAITLDHAIDQTWRDNEWVDERITRWIPSGHPFADPYPLDWMPTHFLHELAPYVRRGNVVAHVDVGELPYVMSDVSFIDGFGLVDRIAGRLAFFPHDRALLELARKEFFDARPTAAIVVFDEATGCPFSASQRTVLDDPRFASGWREIGRVPTWGGHPCVTYVRRDLLPSDNDAASSQRRSWLANAPGVVELP